ncbi:MAG: hypothetical protein JW891_03090 [Candidatus Lokiarchaeota archaeon]|nr:hypothetical protein [Candidatus Lokiarchaeota archaeon]
MRFCPNCDNIMLPRNGKLYCQACDEEFDLKNEQSDFKIIKKIKHDDSEGSPIIVKGEFAGRRIGSEDRKAFEEFFSGSEESGY